ncbi:MAG TPA: 16S rRNA (cytosine(967)-C(5))-methyltransferase RsmB [Solirubrobacteraceae bacterium]|jgi:16S rRNA (cytosine967-C5)-methyltransferase
MVDVKRTPSAGKHSGNVAVARRCAHTVLMRVFEQGAYADRALQSEATGLDARDRALAMRLAYGAVQRRGTLDHLIEQLAERSPAKLDAPVRAALRLGLYELLYLSGAPDYAVVADAVELSKSGGGRGHGLVNAVLRRTLREGPEKLLGSLGDETPERAAVMHSHPLWLAELWWSQLGSERARALMAENNEPGELALRVNTLMTTIEALAAALPVASHRDPSLAEALVLDGPLDLHGTPQWESGAAIAQSRAAMLVSRALDPAPGERLLDLCAAPGGKTTHLAALTDGRSEIVAVERNQARTRELGQTVRRMRAAKVSVHLADAAEPGIVEDASFDRVLVDPPCSGLGTLQSRPDLRWRVRAEALGQMTALQSRILRNGAAALRPGGVLVYSTCTISPSENERLIADFLDSHPDFALEGLPAELNAPALAGALVDGHDPLPGERQLALTLPSRDRTAGFFITRLKRS